MSYADISRNTGQSSRISRFLKFLADISLMNTRRTSLDVKSMSDDLLADIGLSPEDRLSDLRNINMMNASIRSGIILPRPC